MIKKSTAEIAALAAEHQLMISLNVGRTEIEDGKFWRYYVMNAQRTRFLYR